VTADIAVPKRHGLAVLWDVLVAPSAAFAELRNVPHWGWAFLITCVLGTIGSYLQILAGEHISSYAFAHEPSMAALTSEQLENAKKSAAVIQQYAWLFFAIEAMVAVLLCTGVLLVANAIGRGNATFAKLFALSANVALLNFGIGTLLRGVIASSRGADGFQTTIDLLGVVPNLAWLAPGAAPKAVAFLASFSVFQIWSTALIALGLRSIANLGPAIAWATPIVIALLGGLLVTASVH